MSFNILKVAQRRLQRSIQTRLFVMLFLLGVISLSALVITSVKLGRSEIQSEVSRRNQEIATLIAGQVDDNLNYTINNLNAQVQSLSEGWKNSIPILRFTQQAYTNGYQSVTLVDKDGVALFSFKARPEDMGKNIQPSIGEIGRTATDFSQNPAYLGARENQTYISPIRLAAPTNSPQLTIAVPIRTDFGLFNGCVVVDLDLRLVVESINRLNVEKTTKIAVLDSLGHIYASTDPASIGQMFGSQGLGPVVNKQYAQTIFTDDKGQEILAGYAPIKTFNGWSVIVARSMEEAAAGINRLALIAGGMAIFLIMITCLIGIWVANSITRPVRELAIAANRITTTGNLDEQIPITTQDEVGELTASFNGMILALRKTRMALEHWNRELEHKVEVRTQEQALINSKLEQTNNQLERANLHKSQFLANMSHELRTPLNAIIGFSEVMQDQVFGELNDKQRRYVNNILTSGRHLLNLVNDVLDLSKVEAGKMELHCEEFSSCAAVYEVQTQLSTLAAQKDLQTSADVSDGLDRIVADRARFRQILYNLLSNAIKFTPQGGRINVTGQIDKSGITPCAVFAINDTGIGVSPENVERIFESFRQVDNSYSRQYQGTGLGLALTKKLVEMHGGKIWVESEPGVGSTFSFTIPLTNSLASANSLLTMGAADAGALTAPGISRKEV